LVQKCVYVLNIFPKTATVTATCVATFECRENPRYAYERCRARPILWKSIKPRLRHGLLTRLGRPMSSQARLALDLLRYTTGRREDAPRLGRQHMRDGRVRFRQAKNEHRNPIDIDIPLHPALATSIAAAGASTNMTFLLTQFARPFTANGSETSSRIGAVKLTCRIVRPTASEKPHRRPSPSPGQRRMRSWR
jgi:hypothetical protein